MLKQKWYKYHVGDYLYAHPAAHKVTVDKYGYPTIHSTCGFTYENHKKEKVRKMIQVHMSKDSGRISQIHLFHNKNDERHLEPYKPTPVWSYVKSLHNDEED